MARAYAPHRARSRLAACALISTMSPMERPEASQQIRDHCNTVSTAVMKIHPLLNALGDDATKGEVVKALFEITKNVEVIKKQIMRLERRYDSTLL
jgi:hypothetical protein